MEGATSAHGSNSARISLLEQRLLELQVYSDEALVRKEGSVRSTRAFSDALLNVEMKLMRQREAELLQRVAELERAVPGSHQVTADEIRRLTATCEELRLQCGDKANQMRILQLEAKDKVIQNLTRALAESRKETQAATEQMEAMAADVLLLQRQLRAGGGAGEAVAASASGNDEDDFDSFLAAATSK